MEENPYKAPGEVGAGLSDYRRIAGWCAWAMLVGVVVLNPVAAILRRMVEILF
jgi:hypothetical protein